MIFYILAYHIIYIINLDAVKFVLGGNELVVKERFKHKNR
jgi:hypothetical protein